MPGEPKIRELRVVASDRPDASVEVHADPADREQADAVRVELVGRELRVTGAALGLLQKLTPRTPGRSLEVEVALPSGSAVHASTTYGGVTTEGRLGTCEVRAATATSGSRTPSRPSSPSATARRG